MEAGSSSQKLAIVAQILIAIVSLEAEEGSPLFGAETIGGGDKK